MAEKVTAPDGWYDGKLVGGEYKETENGASILELYYDVGEEYHAVREGIFLKSVPTGDPKTDAERLEWTKNHVARIKEAFPGACTAGGNLAIVALTNPDEKLKAALVRVRVTNDANGYAKAKVYPNNVKSRPKVSKEEAMKLLRKDSRALASLGISVEGAETTPVTPSQSSDDSDIPF